MTKPASAKAATLEERLAALAEEVVAATSFYLVEVNVRGHRGTRVVEVYVDCDEDMGLDDLAEVSRELEFLLDVEDVVDGGYKLEVSSPGVDRPLVLPRQYRKNVGRSLRVRYRMNGSDDKIEGTLVEASEDAIAIETGPGATPQRIPYDSITEAVIQLPW